MGWVARRRLLTFVAATVLVASGLVFDSNTALARKDCNSADPAADLSVVQTMTLASDGTNILKHITVTNFGPCNVHDVTLDDTLPDGSLVVSITTNPSGWTCDQPQPPLPAPGPVHCFSTSSVGVPGTVDFFITITPPTGANVTDTATASSALDKYPDNNTSAAAYVAAGSSSCITTIPIPCLSTANLVGQNAQVKVPGSHNGSGSATIAQLQGGKSDARGLGGGLPTCPTEVPQCFGKYVSFVMDPTITAANDCTSTATASCVIKVFIYDAADVTVSFGQLKMFHATSLTGPYSEALPCGKDVPLPCVLSTTRIRSADGHTFFVILVATKDDDSWIG